MYKTQKFCLTMMCFSVMASAFAQQNTQTITRLDFPYHKGYHMVFEGRATDYVYENIYMRSKDPELDTAFSSMIYYINDEYPDKKDTVVNFNCRFIKGDDFTTTNTNPLVVNNDGMYYWVKNNESDSTTYGEEELSKKQEKNKYYDIRTPLYKGKKWSGKDQGLNPQEYECIAIDTILQTGMGPLHAFGIQETTTVPYEDNKDIEFINVNTQYYAQKYGKVSIQYTSYVHLKSQDANVLFHEEFVMLKKVWWDEK